MQDSAGFAPAVIVTLVLWVVFSVVVVVVVVVVLVVVFDGSLGFHSVQGLSVDVVVVSVGEQSPINKKFNV